MIRPIRAIPRRGTPARRKLLTRTPEEEREIQRRVRLYVAQMERTGRIRWEPRPSERGIEP